MSTDTPMQTNDQAQAKASGSLVSQAYHLLKADIISGVCQPGEKLLMSHLKEHYQIGAGPMREALSQLVSERLVTAINQRGFRVAKMSLEELRDIYDARSNLEVLLVRLAVERGQESWEANILGKAHTLSRVDEVNSAEEMLSLWDTRHKEFHNAIVEGCGSPKLLEMRTLLFDQAERYRQLWLRETVFSKEALEQKRAEHSEIVDALLKRDADLACELIHQHLMSPVTIIQEIMQTR